MRGEMRGHPRKPAPPARKSPIPKPKKGRGLVHYGGLCATGAKFGDWIGMFYGKDTADALSEGMQAYKRGKVRGKS